MWWKAAILKKNQTKTTLKVKKIVTTSVDAVEDDDNDGDVDYHIQNEKETIRDTADNTPFP